MPILYTQPDLNSLAQSGFNYAQSKVYDLIEAKRAQLWQQTAVNATSNSIEKNKKDIEKALETGKLLRENLASLAGEPWPNSIGNNPKLGSDPDNKIGFLSTRYISPTVGLLGLLGVKKRVGQYEYKDWTGQVLTKPDNQQKTEDRFKTHKKLMTTADFKKDRYSLRDFLLIFGDTRTDYFKYGLQTIDNLTPIENPENGNSSLRLDSFKGTPWEQSDPVYFGFDIVFDAVSSPLLNGSVLDFLSNYTSVSELSSKILVYDEFINQFTKFFRTNAKPVQSSQRDNIAMTKTRPHFTGHANSVSNFANLDENTPFFKPGKSAYFSNYIKKVGGLDSLIESNKGDTFKYLTDYRKDFITITTTEDVTLSMGTLAHLYKLLYWSKPNGKHLVPDNLLRFNCDIIVSEVRNMQRVRKNIQTGNLEVLKDNLSRWVFSLKECQFFFDKLPIENDIDLGAEPKQFETFTINMDFKYSTHRLERFVPNGDWGSYVGYDAGSIWKIGNKGSDNKGGTSSLTSNPSFVTTGNNSFNENGVNKPNTLSVYSNVNEDSTTSDEDIDIAKKNDDKSSLKSKEASDDKKSEEKTSKFKTPGEIISGISKEQVKRALNIASDITGITPQRVLNSATSAIRNSTFFDNNGSLGGAPNTPSNTGLSGGGLFGTPYSSPITQDFTNVQFGRPGNTRAPYTKPVTQDFTNVQFPASAQKLPEPVTSKYRLSKDGSSVLINRTITQDFTNVQFGRPGNTRAPYSPPVMQDFTNVQFPASAQKLPPPVTYRLLNEAIYKVYAAEKFKNSKSKTPNSTSFFDIKNQLKDFLGGPLGDKLTGE